MNITRRSALLGTAAAMSVAAPVAMAEYLTRAAARDTDLLALSDRYWSHREEALELDRSAPGKPKAEYDAIYDRVAELDDDAFEIAERVADMSALTPKGLAAKLRIVRLECGFPEHVKQTNQWDRYDQAVALGLWTAIEDAERVARVSS